MTFNMVNVDESLPAPFRRISRLEQLVESIDDLAVRTRHHDFMERIRRSLFNTAGGGISAVEDATIYSQ